MFRFHIIESCVFCILCTLRFKHIQSAQKMDVWLRKTTGETSKLHNPAMVRTAHRSGAQHFAGVDVALWAGAIGWGPGVGILAECDMNWRFLKDTSVKICYNLKVGTKISSWITLISWSTSWESARLAFDFATFATLHTSTLPSAPSVLSPHAMHQSGIPVQSETSMSQPSAMMGRHASIGTWAGGKPRETQNPKVRTIETQESLQGTEWNWVQRSQSPKVPNINLWVIYWLSIGYAKHPHSAAKAHSRWVSV